jgi:hypothetical protein
METNQIWRVEHLRDRMNTVASKLGNQDGMPGGDSQTPSAFMVEVLAQAGYHQTQAIADAFGVDFEENFSNEDEWDRFRREVDVLKAEVELELQRRLELPGGILFHLGYDPEGNFGLILRSAGPETAVPPRCSSPLRKETAS